MYSYDINGNVKTLIPHIRALAAVDTNGKKRVDYDYDLVSGKVNMVSYQSEKGDQFFYKYHYDADNRVTRSYSSRDKLIWEEDASYGYYLHGPLARTELGNYKVQGVDYAYTLQGWLKGINSDSLNANYDIGNDGKAGAMFSRVSRDVYGFKIGYYNNDYTPIGGATAPALANKGYTHPGSLDNTGNQLFNGNISYTTLALSKINSGTTTGYSYGYDQLNRLTEMRQHTTGTTSGWSNSNIITAYRESIAYDANGNILKYLRKGTAATLDMDSMNYNYNRDGSGNLLNNKLNHVRDQVSSGNYAVDIDNQSSNNYVYDKIGNLKKDVAEGIDTIRWTVYGKINKIIKNGGATTIEYGYDPGGNRTTKKVTNNDTIITTYYVRDAQGNVLAVYSKKDGEPLKWNEQHLYGSSRLGIWNWNDTVPAKPPVVDEEPIYDSSMAGNIHYELTDHLGNVRSIISDKKIGNDSSGVVNYYIAEVLSQTDFYPGGMQMPGRKYQAGSDSYRYGFQNQETDNEFWGGAVSFKYRVEDPRLGRFFSVDPLTAKYPHNSPYAFSENRVIDGRELEGLEYVSIHHYADGTDGYKRHYQRTKKQVKDAGGTTAGIYNSASYGAQGKGVVHYYWNSDGTIDEEKTRWDQQQTGGTSDYKFHGLYSGPGSITDRKGNYDFSFQPIDWADAIAKRHDMDYVAATAKGEAYAGFLEDIRTVQADRDMVQRIEDYKDLFKDVKGVETPYRTSWSGEMEFAMKGQSVVISALATYKQWKIDHKYGNKDTYDKLRDEFRKDNKLVAAVIDLIKPKK